MDFPTQEFIRNAIEHYLSGDPTDFVPAHSFLMPIDPDSTEPRNM